MAEEKKLDALSDEALEAIAGGLDDTARVLLDESVALAKRKGLTLDEAIAMLESRATPDDAQKVAEYREYIMSIW